ncbi:MAG: type II toxin-antitoxin system Phd/YefM family antitoxin [Pseudomonadota bacterium]
MQIWQIQEAKARLSELVKRAQSQPQDITLHGKSVAVVLSREAYDRLACSQGSLVELMAGSPFRGADDVHFEREPGMTRELEF